MTSAGGISGHAAPSSRRSKAPAMTGTPHSERAHPKWGHPRSVAAREDRKRSHPASFGQIAKLNAAARVSLLLARARLIGCGPFHRFCHLFFSWGSTRDRDPLKKKEKEVSWSHFHRFRRRITTSQLHPAIHCFPATTAPKCEHLGCWTHISPDSSPLPRTVVKPVLARLVAFRPIEVDRFFFLFSLFFFWPDGSFCRAMESATFSGARHSTYQQ